MDFIDGIHLDVLKEIGNIGAGNAATSLSKMLSRRVDMKVPEVKIMPFNQVETVVGRGALVVGIYLNLPRHRRDYIIYNR